MKLNVLYEDNHIIVVQKPVNTPVCEDISQDEDLLNEVKKHIKQKYQKPGNVYCGIVHRLDRPVGGVMVFAKTSKAASRLSEQIRKGEMVKEYLAVLRGELKQKQGKLVDYLLKDTNKNIVKVANENTKNSKKAELEYEVLGYKDGLTLVRVKLKTGRSHQIRVQFKNLGYPLYGDQKYGKDANKVGQQLALFSCKIGFIHPTKKEYMEFTLNPDSNKKPWNILQLGT